MGVKSKNSIKKIRIKVSYRIVVLVIIAFFLFISILFKERFDEIKYYDDIIKQMKAKNNELNQKILMLEKEISELKTYKGVERIAREKLKLIKKGEEIIKIVKNKGEIPGG